MNRHIKKVAILGSGVMGSRIAALFASIGVRVLLLDMPTRDASEGDTVSRNKLVNDYLKSALKSNPSPIYHPSFAERIKTGNFDDNMEEIKDADWIIEVVIERLDIKKVIFEKVDKYRKPNSIVSSNTSGIPIHLMAEERSENFKSHFCGTHFFNPPRYLKLLEIIPTADTNTALVDFLMSFGTTVLGKKTVLAKDTPAFIGNRVGVFSIGLILKYLEENDLTITEVDKLTGPVIGRPKSATFRTADVVGIDTLALVANTLADNLQDDAAKAMFRTPEYVNNMVEKGWLGSKTKQGFYKKVKDENGKSSILALDLKTMAYAAAPKVKFSALEKTKLIPKLEDRFEVLLDDDSKVGAFYRHTLLPLFAYAANRIPEIADHLFQIDDAVEAGFNWEIGPFKIWDAYGLRKGVEAMEVIGEKVADWVYEMLDAGIDQFYKKEDGVAYFYNQDTKAYEPIPGMEHLVQLDNLSGEKIVWSNSGTKLYDLGDGILNLAFETKMNAIGGDVIAGINKAIDIAEEGYRGLVISNNGANFSAGANVGMIFMMAVEQEFDELNFSIALFQNTMMRIRYSSIPVVAAPHNLALGGGCELCMHADKVVAHAELYMGLVEFGVGVIPGGGGTKEFAVRLSDDLGQDDVRLNRFRDRFLTIGQAKVSTSAYEAFDYGYLQKHKDIVVTNRQEQLTVAKQHCLDLANRGYLQPMEREDILVLGKEALGLAYIGANTMESGNYISEHDSKISRKLAWVLAGGDLSKPTKVSERYLLDLERKAFLELCMERKTLERLQSIITTNKVLRN